MKFEIQTLNRTRRSHSTCSLRLYCASPPPAPLCSYYALKNNIHHNTSTPNEQTCKVRSSINITGLFIQGLLQENTTTADVCLTSSSSTHFFFGYGALDSPREHGSSTGTSDLNAVPRLNTSSVDTDGELKFICMC